MALIFVGTLAQTQIGVWEAVDSYFRGFVAWVDLSLFIPEASGAVPMPGGATLGLLLLANLVAAHAVRFKLGWRRVGMILIHGGLIVLLAGEFATAWLADEGLMAIDEGATSSYYEDVRSVELAVIDRSPEDHDRVVTIPAAVLRRAAGDTAIRHDSLPFEVEVLRWMPNARLLRDDSALPADRGIGLEAVAQERPRARGGDGAQSDAPAAYVRLTRDGKQLGTWLVWAGLVGAQPVEIEGQTYGLALRYARTYLPYRLTLHDFRHDTFTGTTIARNFSSDVRLVDEARGVDREVRIWMNNPLRYRGATFYQASYKPDGSGTVLQVVRNPGAALPYISCALVAAGLLLHFGLAMTTFLRRRSKRLTKAGATAPRRSLWPWAVGVLGVALAVGALARPVDYGAFDLDTFERLPVSAGGRLKPMDTAARHALMVAGGRQSVGGDEPMPAVAYLVGLVADPESVAHLPVVRVDHPGVLALLGLTPDEGGRLGLSDIEPHWGEVAEQAHQAMDIDAKGRDPFQRAVLGLYTAVDTLLAHAQLREPFVVPPLGPEGHWRSFYGVMMRDAPFGAASAPEDMHPTVAYMTAMMTAYSQDDAEGFNGAAAGYEALLRDSMPGVMRRMDIEVAFNRARPFVGTASVYVLAFVLLCGSLLMRARAGERGEPLRRSAVAILWGGLLVHTVAIAVRIYLQDRPPVTNLYSSAIFVGWASVLFALVLERLYPLGVAALGAASVGFATLVVAHNLGDDGDTMQMMQAVLDSNFWLATHVVTITLGYSATFLAGALGALYLMLGVFTRLLTRERAQALGRMVYGVVCFALLLSFVGTVLGGIWADQSWGRFWGWDPKENGAALVVLLNAIILHARWGGLVRVRGIMVLAVAGNIVTAWSWFGTNMLGVGLHSYGFMDSATMLLIGFVVSQFLCMSLGLLPVRAWRSSIDTASQGEPARDMA
jgi:ABC-type transport system involved in cytochrome c biogenesis permease subunit